MEKTGLTSSTWTILIWNVARGMSFSLMLKKSGPQHAGHRLGAKRQARVATVGLLHSVDRQETDWID